METMFSRRTDAPASVAFVRIAAGVVFVVSGLLKFLYENQGVGRFTKLGLPAPAVLSPFVGAVEIIGGTLLILGLFTRLAAVPLIIDMLVAIGWTKVPFLFGPGREPVSAPPKTGLFAFLYQARLDLTMLACVIFFLIAGAGVWSLDARARSKE
ncbi:MAG: DoxX family protein [Polyangiales bacterium]